MPLPAFKAYDIRGRVPEELNEDMARKIGKALAAELDAGPVVLGHDVRLTSPALQDALAAGLRGEGREVIDIGLCGTEEVYFQTGHLRAAGGVMVTASHNPMDYNGMKLVREQARPISSDTGLFAISDAVAADDSAPQPPRVVLRAQPYGVGVGDGGLAGQGLGAQRGEPGDGFVQRGGVHVQQRDARALACKGLRRAVADALRAAGDDDRLAAQLGMNDFSGVVHDVCLCKVST